LKFFFQKFWGYEKYGVETTIAVTVIGGICIGIFFVSWVVACICAYCRPSWCVPRTVQPQQPLNNAAAVPPVEEVPMVVINDNNNNNAAQEDSNTPPTPPPPPPPSPGIEDEERVDRDGACGGTNF
jgi:hypothetical protein